MGVLVGPGEVAEEQGGVRGVGDVRGDQRHDVLQLGEHVVADALADGDRVARLVERHGDLRGRLGAHRLREQLVGQDVVAHAVLHPDGVDAVLVQGVGEARRDGGAVPEERDAARARGREIAREREPDRAAEGGEPHSLREYRRMRDESEPECCAQPASQAVRCPSWRHITGKNASSSSRSPGRR
jgi:hypothetical protein